MNSAIALGLQRRAKGRRGAGYPLMLPPLLAFLGFLALGMFLVNKLNEDARSVEAAQTRVVAATFASSVERVISRALTATRSLAVMVYQGQGKVEDFERLALFLLPMYKGAYALSLAPDGIIRQIEPLDRNLLVRDHDVLEGRDREQVIAAIDPDKPVIEFAGPFQLIQGPVGAVGMLPIYLPAANGTSTFWGFTVVTLVLPDALQDANLDAMSLQGYAYELSGMDPEEGHRRVIARSAESLLQPTCEDVHIELVRWTLCVAPREKLSAWSRHQFELILVVVCSLGIGALVLDGFKPINDILGHAQGDVVLRIVAERLTAAVRSHDVVARIGGDEFVIILGDLADEAACRGVLEAVLKTVGEPMPLADGPVTVSASIGVVMLSAHDLSHLQDLIRAADEAMYYAKGSGKNRIHVSALRFRSPSQREGAAAPYDVARPEGP